jgi:hypothetical protein
MSISGRGAASGPPRRAGGAQTAAGSAGLCAAQLRVGAVGQDRLRHSEEPRCEVAAFDLNDALKLHVPELSAIARCVYDGVAPPLGRAVGEPEIHAVVGGFEACR